MGFFSSEMKTNRSYKLITRGQMQTSLSIFSFRPAAHVGESNHARFILHSWKRNQFCHCRKLIVLLCFRYDGRPSIQHQRERERIKGIFFSNYKTATGGGLNSPVAVCCESSKTFIPLTMMGAGGVVLDRKSVRTTSKIQVALIAPKEI